MSYKIFGPIVACAAALGLAVSQHAAGQAASSASAPDLGEIVVTARRVEERAQDVPISMTIFNQRQLSDRSVVTSSDLAAATPSMQVDNGSGDDMASFSIRGFVQTLQSTPSVAVYFADAVVPRGGNVGVNAGSGVPTGSFFDLQNVQVLKGPQGTLFGRNTDGGAVLLVPQKPTEDFEGYVEGSVGSHDMREVQGVLNLPLSENVRLRLSVNDETRNGYENNVSGIGPSEFDNIDYTAARLSLVVDVTPNLENYTVGTYNLSVNNGLLPQLFACNPAQGAGTTLCPATLGALAGKGDYAVANTLPGAQSYLKQIQAINTTSWHASDNLTVKNIANYGELITAQDSGLFGGYILQEPGVAGYIPYLTSTDDPSAIGAKTTDQYTWSDELQLSGNALDNKLLYQGGLYVERSGPLGDPTGTRSGTFLICPDIAAFLCSGPGVVGENLATIHFNDEALFGQASYAVTDRLKVTGGVRYTWDRTTALVNSTTYAGFPEFLPGAPAYELCSSAFATVANSCGSAYAESSKAPTGVIDLDYNPTQDVLVYGKYARGYRQGGVATFVSDGYHVYGPEHVDSYELGEKTTFTGPIRGTFDVTAHYNNFTDQQLLAGFLGPEVSPSSGIVNAGKSRIWGIEIESTLQPIDPMTLGLSYSYLNTKLLTAFAALPPGGAYTEIEFPTTQGGVLPYSPKDKVSANATYHVSLPDSVGKVSVAANYTYTSSMLISTTAAPYDTLSGHGLLGMNLHWDSIAGSRVDGEMFVTNLTDKLYYTNLTALYNTAFGLAGRIPGEPRMYGLRVRVRFGK
jgi:iron complex outermembrane receptor protein